jgi:hypothetical protein
MRPVDLYPGDDDQIVFGSAAAYRQLAIIVVDSDCAWEHLQGLEDVLEASRHFADA